MTHIYGKMIGLSVLIVLTVGSLHTKPPPYDFKLYGACLHEAPGTALVRPENRRHAGLVLGTLVASGFVTST